MSGRFWMTRTMGAVCFGSAAVALIVALLTGVWTPFFGALTAGLIFTPFMAWLESWT